MILTDTWIPRFVETVPPGPVLDLGAGEGVACRQLASAGHEVLGVELDQSAVIRARRFCAAYPGVALRQQDARDVHIAAEHYAGILLSNILQFMSRDQGRALVDRVKQGTRPGGSVLVIAFSLEDPARKALMLAGDPVPFSPETWVDDSGLQLAFYDLQTLRGWFEGWTLEVATEELIEETRGGQSRMRGQVVVLARRPAVPQQHRTAPETVSWVAPGPWPRALPLLGAGPGLRRAFEKEIAQHRHRFDVLEVMVEEYMEPVHRHRLRTARSIAPLVTHGTTLNLGSAGGPPESHLAAILDTVADSGTPWFSDHLCFTGTPEVDTAALIPLPFTEEAVEKVGAQLARVRGAAPVPLLVENIAYYFHAPHSTMDEPTFLRRVLERADAGLLLDVCNVVLNAENHGYDPFAFVDALPLERVVQLHLAGGDRRGGLAYDTHAAPVDELTWRLYEHILRRAPVACVILERDQRIPPLAELLLEVERARELFRRHRGKPEAA